MKKENKRIKFVCKGEIVEAAPGKPKKVELSVKRTVVGIDSPFFHVNGQDNIWTFYFDILCPITITQHNGTTRDTGYGLLADILDVVGYREHP